MDATKTTQITKEMTIGEVVKNYPETIEVMMNYGLHCIGCNVSYDETLAQGTAGHGWNEARVTELLEEMNGAVEKEKNASTMAMNADGNGSGAAQVLSVTNKAAGKIKELMGKQPDARKYLKLNAVPGGCNGFTYGMGFAGESTQDDEVVEAEGVKFLVEKESLQLLKGIKIDYVDALQNAGFKITNPNAKSTCGCGQSFG